MGRKALPANVHLINGNPSKKRFSVLADGARVPVEIPKMPKHLDAGAKREWKLIVPELEKLGLLARIDRAALAMYCVAFSRWEKAELKIKEMQDDGLIDNTPNGHKQMSVWLQIANRAMEQIKSSLGDFGMSPSARAKVNVNLQHDLFGDDPDNKPAPNPAAKYFRSR